MLMTSHASNFYSTLSVLVGHSSVIIVNIWTWQSDQNWFFLLEQRIILLQFGLWSFQSFVYVRNLIIGYMIAYKIGFFFFKNVFVIAVTKEDHIFFSQLGNEISHYLRSLQRWFVLLWVTRLTTILFWFLVQMRCQIVYLVFEVLVN